MSFDYKKISQASIYRVLYCISRDIENNRPINSGVETLHFKMSQTPKNQQQVLHFLKSANTHN